MRKLYQSILNRLRLWLLNTYPNRETCLIAESGKVTIRLHGLNIHLTPQYARKLAGELPAFATIAERLQALPEVTP